MTKVRVFAGAGAVVRDEKRCFNRAKSAIIARHLGRLIGRGAVPRSVVPE
jgi:hypothetical protein